MEGDEMNTLSFAGEDLTEKEMAEGVSPLSDECHKKNSPVGLLPTIRTGAQ
jgi:hypothetical protein